MPRKSCRVYVKSVFFLSKLNMRPKIDFHVLFCMNDRASWLMDRPRRAADFKQVG